MSPSDFYSGEFRPPRRWYGNTNFSPPYLKVLPTPLLVVHLTSCYTVFATHNIVYARKDELTNQCRKFNGPLWKLWRLVAKKTRGVASDKFWQAYKTVEIPTSITETSNLRCSELRRYSRKIEVLPHFFKFWFFTLHYSCCRSSRYHYWCKRSKLITGPINSDTVPPIVPTAHYRCDIFFGTALPRR